MASADKKGGLYIGVGSMPLIVEGMADAHVSDWEKFGLGGAEGRMMLAMADGNINSAALPGIEFGATYNLIPNLDVGLAMGFYVGDITGASVSLAADYYVWSNDTMRLGLRGSAGFAFGTMSLGTATILDGYTNPVVVDSDTVISDGDTLSAGVSGFVSGGEVSFEYHVNGDLSVRVHGGYQYGELTGGSLDAGEGETAVQVELSHAAIVKTDGSSTQAGISPTGSSIGFIGGLSVVWRTNFDF